jgi:osmoprotectant transport system substrate-binding protein
MRFIQTGVRLLIVTLMVMVVVACGNTTTGTTTGQTDADAGEGAATAPEVTPEPAADQAEAPAAAGGPIRVGSKNFTEEFILGELYAQLLEANGFTVERKLNLGATPIAHQALVNDEIDLYPEYTSTGLMEVLKLPQQRDRQEIFNTVKDGYEEQFQVTWLEPAPFNNTNTFAMTRARAEELGIRTYSDLSARASEVVLGGPPEFLEREDTQGLIETYGGFDFREVRQLDGSLRYQALIDGQIDVVVAFGTDGQIGGYDLLVLEDDQNYYPPYQVAPVVRQDTLAENPRIAEVLNSLAPLLDDGTMARLNWQVDGPDNQEPDEVARQFLLDQGLIQ